MKKMSKLLFLLLVPITIFADFGQQWATRYNGTGNSLDFAYAIVTDNSGNAYVTGYSTGLTTSKDLFTIKYSPSGVPLWTASYNGPVNGGDYSFAICLDQAGNVYVTGRSDRGANSSDYTTIKYNNNGVQQWVALYDGPAHFVDEAKAICVDNSGNVYITGKSTGVGTNFDIVTVKYNSSGAQQWAYTYNGTANGDDVANGIAVDNSGNVYVCGGTVGAGFDYVTMKINPNGSLGWLYTYNGPASGGDVAVGLALNRNTNELYVSGYSYGGPTSNYDVVTIKYNQAGTQLWLKRFNGPSNDADIATALALDPSGYIIITGTSVTNNTDSNFATIKYTPAGDIQWASYYAGPGQTSDIPRSICTDGAGNIYVSGSSSQNVATTDYVTIKYFNVDGTLIWMGTYNGPDNREDFTTAIAVDGDANIFVTGRSYATASNYDYATIKYGDLTGLNHTGNTIPSEYNLYQNYPNPFNPTTKIKFDLPQSSQVNLMVYNMLGETIFNKDFDNLSAGQYEYTFDAANSSTGVYFYRVSAGSFTSTKKMILVK